MCFGVIVTIVFGQSRVQQTKCNLAPRKLTAVWHGLYTQKTNDSNRGRRKPPRRRGHLAGWLHRVANSCQFSYMCWYNEHVTKHCVCSLCSQSCNIQNWNRGRGIITSVIYSFAGWLAWWLGWQAGWLACLKWVGWTSWAVWLGWRQHAVGSPNNF